MRKILEIFLVISLLPLLVPLVLFHVATRLLHGVALNVLVWVCWCTRGTHFLLVYSDSPVWHDYMEENIIPRLPNSTIILNWSQHRTWRWYSLPVMVVRYFGGTREFNPMVVAFLPFRWAKTFRFWQAFKDYKHDNRRTLECDMFAYLAQTRRVPCSPRSGVSMAGGEMIFGLARAVRNRIPIGRLGQSESDGSDPNIRVFSLVRPGRPQACSPACGLRV